MLCAGGFTSVDPTQETVLSSALSSAVDYFPAGLSTVTLSSARSSVSLAVCGDLMLVAGGLVQAAASTAIIPSCSIDFLRLTQAGVSVCVVLLATVSIRAARAGS